MRNWAKRRTYSKTIYHGGQRVLNAPCDTYTQGGEQKEITVLIYDCCTNVLICNCYFFYFRKIVIDFVPGLRSLFLHESFQLCKGGGGGGGAIMFHYTLKNSSL